MASPYFLDIFDRIVGGGVVGNNWIETEILTSDVNCATVLQFNAGAEVKQASANYLSSRQFIELECEVDFTNTSQTLIHRFYVYFAGTDSSNRIGLRMQPGAGTRLIRNYLTTSDVTLGILSDWAIGYEVVRFKIVQLRKNIFFYLWDGSKWVKSSVSHQNMSDAYYNLNWKNYFIRVFEGVGSGVVDIKVNYFRIRNISPNLAKVDS